MRFSNSIWITWERQRRTLELSRILASKLYLLEVSLYRPIRYFYLLTRTLFILLKERPVLVFAQNPSIVLAAFLCVFRKVLRYKLVVDRHSNFKLATIHDKRIKWKVFHYLSKFSVRKADITIVTNDVLLGIVNSWGGNGFVLQDKLPELKLGKATKLDGVKNIVFISTFSNDEPILEVIDAAKVINKNFIIYITGNYEKYRKREYILHNLPNNVRLTGFLPEKEYQSLLMSSDLLIVLTTEENVLTCGAYEGVSLLKPMVVSDTTTIRGYFSKGVVYSKPDAVSISIAIKKGISNSILLEKGIVQLKENITISWDDKFNKLCLAISEL